MNVLLLLLYRTSELQSRTPLLIKYNIMPRGHTKNVGAAEVFFAAFIYNISFLFIAHVCFLSPQRVINVINAQLHIQVSRSR